jgi:hypothetical protein
MFPSSLRTLFYAFSHYFGPIGNWIAFGTQVFTYMAIWFLSMYSTVCYAKCLQWCLVILCHEWDVCIQVVLLALTTLKHYYYYYYYYYGSTAVCWPWTLFQFLNIYTVGRTPWTGDQPVAKPLPTHTEQHKHRINAHRHPCLEWDSNIWSKNSRERR